MDGKKILLTGCPGRLSNAILAALLRKGYDVRLVIRPGLDANKLPKKAGKRLIIDLADGSEAARILLEKFVSGCDCAMQVHGLVDYLAPKQVLMRENCETTKNLLAACKAAGVKKFVYTSSTSVYRKPTYLPVDEKQGFTPFNFYGESKLAAEEAIRASGVPYVILRPTVIAGAEYLRNFSKFISLAAQGKGRLIGNGENRIAWVHVDDVVRAHVMAVEKKVANEDFIIASNEHLTQKQAFDELSRQLGVKPPTKTVSKTTAYAIAKLERLLLRLTGRRPKVTAEEVATIAEDRYYDVSKARKLLRWTPKVSFKTAVKQMVAAWKNQATNSHK